MGAQEFYVDSNETKLTRGFALAVEDARWEYGHGGYTGTIGEKTGVQRRHFTVNGELPTRQEAVQEAERRMGTDEVNSKWDDAEAFKYQNEDGSEGWLIFGLASS